MASEGRWQNHKDIHWYHSKKKEVDAQVQLDEVAEIKRLEEKAMREALGIHEEETIEEDEETIKEKERIRREEIKASLVNSRDEKVVGMGQRGYSNLI